MLPQINGESGFSFCNLTEIVGKHIKTEQDFYDACRYASILGTIQAAYTDMPYLGKVTEDIVKRDALIGVGITGMAECPSILFDPEVQRRGAEIVKRTNQEVADFIGINHAARTTVIKPSGNSAAMTNTSSGIHPFHSRRFIRNVQVNKQEQAGQIMLETNPNMVRESVGNKNDYVISFPMELNGDEIVKNEQTPLEFLELVKLTQQNWIEYGTNFDHPSYKVDPSLRHNVSNTCTVTPESWDIVKDFLWDNKKYFCGVSMLGSTGDLDYPQAPFTEVLDEVQLAERYGPAAILAGGLNIDAIHAFGDLWRAIDTALGRGESLELSMDDITKIIKENTKFTDNGTEFMYKINGVVVSDINAIIGHLQDKIDMKKDWVRRFNKFASKYLNGDTTTTGHCLKHVSIFHQWNQIVSHKDVDWNSVKWEEVLKESGSDTASACSGGACEIIQ